MLRRLLKYEMSAMGRIMLPLYVVLLAVAALFGIFVRTTYDRPQAFGAVGNTVTGISGTVYGTAIAVVVIGTLILIIQRFRKNLLGDEGYLMFTLPVTTGTHIANKAISATLWVIIGAIASIISVLILTVIIGRVDLIEGLQYLWNSLSKLPGQELAKVIVILVETIVLAFLVTAESAVKIYAAIAVGHQWRNHRTFGSILAYVGFGVVEIVVANVADALSIPSRLEAAFYAIAGGENVYLGEYGFAQSAPHAFAAMQFVIGIIAAIAIVLLAIYWVVTWRFLDRKLNLQ